MPRCLEKIPLFDCVEAEGETAKSKPKKINACPYCLSRGHVEEISTRSERFDAVPVLVSYLCQEGCKPQRDQRRYNDANEKKRDFFARYDLAKLAEIEAREIPYWTPPHQMMNVESDTAPWGDKWRAGSSNFRTVPELFTKRNLWAISLLLQNIEAADNEALLFAFSGTIFNATKMYKHREKGGGPQSGTFYLPQVFREIHMTTLFEQKMSNLSRAFDFFAQFPDKPNVCISTQAAIDLSQLPSNTVDYTGVWRKLCRPLASSRDLPKSRYTGSRKKR